MQLDLSSTERAEIERLALAAGYDDPARYVVDLALNGRELLDPATDEELSGSVDMIESGMSEARMGQGVPMRLALQEIAREFGLAPPGRS